VAALSVIGGVVCLAGAWLMRRAQLEQAGRAPAVEARPPRTTALSSSSSAS
jgi:hypothetical protein